MSHRRTSGYDWIWRPTRLAIYARDGNACVRCGSTVALSLDHIHQNLGNDPRNLVTVCQPCNSARGDRSILVFDKAYAMRAIQTSLRPLDRRLGRELAEARWPERFARHRARDRRRTQRRVAA